MIWARAALVAAVIALWQWAPSVPGIANSSTSRGGSFHPEVVAHVSPPVLT